MNKGHLIKRLDAAHAELVEARKIAALSKHGSYEDIGEAIDCVEAAFDWIKSKKQNNDSNYYAASKQSPLVVSLEAINAAKEFCVYTRQEHSTEDRLAQIIQCALSSKDAEIDALRDAIGALKDMVEQRRNDPEKIAAIINGALRLAKDDKHPQ